MHKYSLEEYISDISQIRMNRYWQSRNKTISIQERKAALSEALKRDMDGYKVRGELFPVRLFRCFGVSETAEVLETRCAAMRRKYEKTNN